MSEMLSSVAKKPLPPPSAARHVSPLRRVSPSRHVSHSADPNATTNTNLRDSQRGNTHDSSRAMSLAGPPVLQNGALSAAAAAVVAAQLHMLPVGAVAHMPAGAVAQKEHDSWQRSNSPAVASLAQETQSQPPMQHSPIRHPQQTASPQHSPARSRVGFQLSSSPSSDHFQTNPRDCSPISTYPQADSGRLHPPPRMAAGGLTANSALSQLAPAGISEAEEMDRTGSQSLSSHVQGGKGSSWPIDSQPALPSHNHQPEVEQHNQQTLQQPQLLHPTDHCHHQQQQQPQVSGAPKAEGLPGKIPAGMQASGPAASAPRGLGDTLPPHLSIPGAQSTR